MGKLERKKRPEKEKPGSQVKEDGKYRNLQVVKVMHQKVGEKGAASHAAQGFGDINPANLDWCFAFLCCQDAAGKRELKAVEEA